MGFSLLILYSAGWLNSFLARVDLSSGSLRFPRFPITPSASAFTFCFSILMALLNFSCLIAMGHTSSTVTNSSRDNGHPVLFLILVEMPLVILHLVVVGFRTKVYIFYHVEEVVIIFYFREVSFFIRNKC